MKIKNSGSRTQTVIRSSESKLRRNIMAKRKGGRKKLTVVGPHLGAKHMAKRKGGRKSSRRKRA